MKSFLIIGLLSIFSLMVGCSTKRAGNKEITKFEKTDSVVTENKDTYIAGNKDTVIAENKHTVVTGNKETTFTGNKKRRLTVNKNIIIYGSKECGHCIRFITSMDSAGIKYDFRDVDKDKKLFNEMYQKIQHANVKGYISYPILDIDGRIMVNPNFKEFTELLK